MADQARNAANDLRDEVASARDQLGGKVADTVDRVGNKAKAGNLSGIANEARSAAADITSAAVEQGRHLFESAKEQATGFADQRKNDAAQSVADLATSLRDTGKSFDERPNVQAFIGSAADGLEQLATGLRDRSFADIYADVEDYARRSPATVGAVAVVAGFVLARFIKSSADDLSKAGASARQAGAREAARRRTAAAAHG